MSSRRLLVTSLAVASVTFVMGCAPMEGGYPRSYYGSTYPSYGEPRYYRYGSADAYGWQNKPRYVYIYGDDDDDDDDDDDHDWRDRKAWHKHKADRDRHDDDDDRDRRRSYKQKFDDDDFDRIRAAREREREQYLEHERYKDKTNDRQ